MTRSKLHPIIRPPEEYEHPRSPVRDDSMLGPSEDLDREPDGFPHVAIAAMAVLVILLAATVFALSTQHEIEWVLFVIAVVPLLVYGLARWAGGKRDRLHPSL